MKTIEWSQEMSVGSETLDGHHKILIDCLNQLAPLIDHEDRKDEIRVIVDKLEDFVLIHFSEEEQFMKQAGYPGWRAHKELHDGMYDLVFSLKSDLEHGRLLNAHTIYDALYDWLIKHILGEDQKYVSVLAHPTDHPTDVWHRANGHLD